MRSRFLIPVLFSALSVWPFAVTRAQSSAGYGNTIYHGQVYTALPGYGGNKAVTAQGGDGEHNCRRLPPPPEGDDGRGPPPGDEGTADHRPPRGCPLPPPPPDGRGWER